MSHMQVSTWLTSHIIMVHLSQYLNLYDIITQVFTFFFLIIFFFFTKHSFSVLRSSSKLPPYIWSLCFLSFLYAVLISHFPWFL